MGGVFRIQKIETDMHLTTWSTYITVKMSEFQLALGGEFIA